jgi:tetratricopeptide (TPR) repeat protein
MRTLLLSALILCLLLTCRTATAQPENKQPAQPEKKQQEPEQVPTEKDIPELVAKLGSDFLTERQQARKQLIKLKEKAVSALIAALKSEDFRVRAGAAEVLGFIGSEDAAGELVKLLKDGDTTVREEARKALARIGPAAMKYIAEAMKDAPESERKQFESTVVTLIQKILQGLICKDGSSGSYPGQLDAVVKIGTAAVPALKSIITESEAGLLKHLAIAALGEIGDKSVVPFLEEVYKNDANLRDEAAVVLFQLGKDSCAKDRIKEYNQQLLNSPDDARPHYGLAHLYYKLGKLDESEAEYKETIRLNPSNHIHYYNFACLLATRNKKEEAIEMLKKAIESGYNSLEWIERDKELDNIRNEEKFKSIIKEKFGEQKPGSD